MKFKVTLMFLLAGTRLVLGSLTHAEVNDLQFMREEEKLARDVYIVLYEVLGDSQFGNIAQSEQRHMDSILYLMNLYGVEDPMIDEVGAFANAEIQVLYNDLIDLGLGNRIAAFEVGITIEEVDIADLDAAIAGTENPDLIRVFTNLRDGSYNHLAAFTKGLEALTSTGKGKKNRGR